MLAEQPVVPCGDLGQAIVGDHEGARLRLGQMFEVDGRHFRPAELATGQEPPVTGDHLELGIDQDRHIEAENPDAILKGPFRLVLM